jgi:hypothetical protein
MNRVDLKHLSVLFFSTDHRTIHSQPKLPQIFVTIGIYRSDSASLSAAVFLMLFTSLGVLPRGRKKGGRAQRFRIYWLVFLKNSDRYNRADGISRGGQDTDEVTTKGTGGGRERRADEFDGLFFRF